MASRVFAQAKAGLSLNDDGFATGAMTYEQAIDMLSEDQAFRATVYAMNTILQAKGLYTAEEFEAQFCQFAESVSVSTKADV